MVHTVTLNPALDRIFCVPAIDTGKTLRIQRCEETIGGKGTHVSIHLSLLGLENCAYGLAFGKTGLKILEMLHHYRVKTAFSYWDQGDAESRINYTVLSDRGEALLLAERGVAVTDAQRYDFYEKLQANMRAGDILVLSGDSSNCGGADVYGDLLRMAEMRQVRTCMDADGGVLRRYLQAPLYFIKPNIYELSDLCGRPVQESADSVIEALRSLRMPAIETVAVTMGSHGSVVKHRDAIYCAGTAAVQVCSTVGCGDAFTAGFLYGQQTGRPVEESIQIAAALSGLCAESMVCAGFDLSRLEALAKTIPIKRVW